MSSFLQTLGYVFTDELLLEQALTHPSFYSTQKQKLPVNHFERLEFVGDRVLGLIVGDMLYHEFPIADEGELARRLARLVCKETLAEVAQKMGIQFSLRYARATDQNNAQWITFVSDACEALIGAVYFDGGISSVIPLVRKFWLPLVHQKDMSAKDPKTELQEYVQAQFKTLPRYQIVQQTGPSHEPELTVECCVQDFIVIAKGSSKKLAENNCAHTMLQKIKHL